MENYYKILRVAPNASTTEVLAAYHAARGALHQESLIRQNLKPEDLTILGQQIELAYQTLSDPQKRRDYDELLELNASAALEATGNSAQVWSGDLLKRYREQSNLSLEEVFRITRIPIKYLKALENEVSEDLPARVYIQGFIKNLAHVYKLPTQQTAAAFLEYFDQRYPNRGKS